MNVRGNRDGYLINITKEDIELYTVLQRFFRYHESGNIERLGDGLILALSQRIHDIMLYDEVSVHNLGDSFCFILHDKELDARIVSDLCDCPSIGIMFSEGIQDFLDAIQFEYDFYELPDLKSAMNYASLGGEIVLTGGKYFIRSDNPVYADFLECEHFLTNYKTVVPDIKELEVNELPHR